MALLQHILWLGKNDMLSADSMPLSVSEWYNEIGVSNGGNAYAFNTSGTKREGERRGEEKEGDDCASVA